MRRKFVGILVCVALFLSAASVLAVSSQEGLLTSPHLGGPENLAAQDEIARLQLELRACQAKLIKETKRADEAEHALRFGQQRKRGDRLSEKHTEAAKPAEPPHEKIPATEFLKAYVLAKPVYSDSAELSESRRLAVKEAMRHAWKGYEAFAFGQDELAPIQKAGKKTFGGLGATMIDGLDTLLIMGLNEEFERARKWVETEFNIDRDQGVNFFETTIRIVGGLLSAYDLSKQTVFLDKAKALADRLRGAFSTPSGLPYSDVNIKDGSAKNAPWGWSSLSETATVQLELNYLSHVTGDPSYAHLANRVFEILEPKDSLDGLYTFQVSVDSASVGGNVITFGARADSFYEYMLKTWLLCRKDKQFDMYRRMYTRAMAGMAKHLVKKTSPAGLTFLAEKAMGGGTIDKMDHLVCFVPGMLALGAKEEAEPSLREEHMRLAEELAATCYYMYRGNHNTGLAPEIVRFRPGEDMVIDQGARHNLLRPETVESLFILYRVTGNAKYREWGWNIFQSFEKFARVPSGGYHALKDVYVDNPPSDDIMTSFFLSETLKYLYLLFSPPDTINLDEYVFNTEAHPLSKIKCTY